MAVSLSSNRLANSLLTTPPRTLPATYPTGHLSTGDTPSHFVTLPTTANETAPVVDGQMLSELHGNVVLIKPKAFIDNLMYGQAEAQITENTGTTVSLSGFERRARDEKLAEDCLTALARRNQSQKFKNVVHSLATDESRLVKEVVEGISSYTSNQFTKLVEGIETEKDLYHPLAALFAFIGHFYRFYFNKPAKDGMWSLDIDKSWPVAVHPKKRQPQAARIPLRRGYLVSYNMPFRFSLHVKGPPDLRPDIALVLFSEARKAKSKLRELHWKDVKVPIEVKLRDGFDANRVCQMARYARAIKLEQFDRNFAFSILISKTKCHVFQWDAAQCYVTEIDMHNEPVMFIQVIGRLASMDPQSMGYDARFSNAGRVLASESRTMATRLEVVSVPPTQYHDQRPETEASNTIVIDLLVDRPLFEARGLLFSRFTRVWEGHAKRPSEAFLYEKTKDVPNVARLVGSEAGSRTIDARSTWGDGDVIGVYRKGQEKADLLPHLDMASDEEPFTLYKCKGRSIFKVHDSQELLEATKQWVTGPWGLSEKEILHRDVSSGNLLLGHDLKSPAFIIDLGLAHCSTQPEVNLLSDKSNHQRIVQTHHHLTGTLPFIAQELLGARLVSQTVKHQIHHDAESVFWVLLYVVLLEEQSTHAQAALAALLSTDLNPVHDKKNVFLTGCLNPDFAYCFKLEGRFKDLARFLSRLATIFWDRLTKKVTINLEDIVNVIDTEMSSLPQGSGKKVEPAAVPAGQGSGLSKRKAESAEDPEEQVDENRPGQSTKASRVTRSSSRIMRRRMEE